MLIPYVFNMVYVLSFSLMNPGTILHLPAGLALRIASRTLSAPAPSSHSFSSELRTQTVCSTHGRLYRYAR